jgi:RimJ/RimL family protein N-acetyltransferase
MRWAQQNEPVEETELHLHQAAVDFREGKSLRYLIFLRDGVTLVGSSGFHAPDWDIPSFEIGYWVHSAHARKGYVTEAVIALTAMAFSTLGARRVQLVCDSVNVRSAAVAYRAGFQLEGVLRNVCRNHLTGELGDDMIFSRVV